MTVTLVDNDRISTYGTFIADCKGSSSIYRWILKATEAALEVGIGLVDADTMNVFENKRCFYHQDDGVSYAYTDPGRFYNNNSSADSIGKTMGYRTGDTIMMELDSKTKIISFHKNSKLMYEMKDIKPLKYRLAVALYSHHSYGKACMTLEKFSVSMTE